jgi:hypothetical protein
MRSPLVARHILVILVLVVSPAVAGDEAALLDEARGVAAALPPRLLTVLQREIAAGGYEGAIGACRDFAPQLAKAAAAESGWTIRRVSLKNRNPNAVPDAWERAVLEDFDRRAAAGETPAALEKGETITEGKARVYRYMKALPTQELCLACHGTAERISPAVAARLEELYPGDRATGYRVGEIRGAITLKRAL